MSTFPQALFKKAKTNIGSILLIVSLAMGFGCLTYLAINPPGSDKRPIAVRLKHMFEQRSQGQKDPTCFP